MNLEKIGFGFGNISATHAQNAGGIKGTTAGGSGAIGSPASRGEAGFEKQTGNLFADNNRVGVTNFDGQRHVKGGIAGGQLNLVA